MTHGGRGLAGKLESLSCKRFEKLNTIYTVHRKATNTSDGCFHHMWLRTFKLHFLTVNDSHNTVEPIDLV